MLGVDIGASTSEICRTTPGLILDPVKWSIETLQLGNFTECMPSLLAVIEIDDDELEVPRNPKAVTGKILFGDDVIHAEKTGDISAADVICNIKSSYHLNHIEDIKSEKDVERFEKLHAAQRDILERCKKFTRIDHFSSWTQDLIPKEFTSMADVTVIFQTEILERAKDRM